MTAVHSAKGSQWQAPEEYHHALDSWNFGNENTQIREINQCEQCEWDPDDKVMAAAGKRPVEEVDTGYLVDAELVHGEEQWRQEPAGSFGQRIELLKAIFP
ncbi:MAG: hypothetical protein LQ343_000461 [Gyalolechia ehrenbergii]|nr:MAG: hypothetical protein LQ343_000461 [Gyalolechia ehrenbergii]